MRRGPMRLLAFRDSIPRSAGLLPFGPAITGFPPSRGSTAARGNGRRSWITAQLYPSRRGCWRCSGGYLHHTLSLGRTDDASQIARRAASGPQDVPERRFHLVHLHGVIGLLPERRAVLRADHEPVRPEAQLL